MGLQNSKRVDELRERFWAAKTRIKQASNNDPPRPPDESKQEKPKYILEVFCGSGRLANELGKVGFKVIGFDHVANKDIPLCKLVHVDLTTENGARILKTIIEEHRVVYVHFAPPCGTATRAREIRRSTGVGPKPLRSMQYPEGFPDLTGTNRDRVQSANKLYKL
eukprot:10347396-Karenia_brevis.AAC.1